MTHVKCNHCGWKGDEGDLKLKPDYDAEGEFLGHFELCPKCGEHDAIMDLEEDSMTITDEYEYGRVTITTDGEDVWVEFYVDNDGIYSSNEFRLSKDEIAKMKAILDRVVSE